MTGYQTGFYSPQRGGVAKYPGLWRGCVGAWSPSLGPTGNTLFDQSAYRNNGSFAFSLPPAAWVPNGGKVAIRGTGGSAGSVSVPNGSQYDSGTIMSCTFWRRSASSSLQFMIDQQSAKFRIFFNTQFNIELGGFGTQIRSDLKVSDGLWHFYAIVATPSVSTWIDGSKVTSGTAAAFHHNSVMQIGSRQSGADSLNGEWDDLRRYNRPLTDSEVSTLSLRRGIAYERARRRRAYVAGGGFQPAWAANSNVVMSI